MSLANPLQTSAQLTSVLEADVTNLVRLRSSLKDEHRARTGTGLTLTSTVSRSGSDPVAARQSHA